MDEYKHMSDEELIKTLRKYNLPHGPIVGTTRKLYEKKVYEYERKKGRFQPSFGSHDSRPQFRDYDDENDIYEEETITRTVGYPQAYQRSNLESLPSKSYYKENSYQQVSQVHHPSQGVKPRRPIREKVNEEAPRKRFFPLWLQLLLLVLLSGFLAYMYFFSEEEENPFKKISE